MTIPPVILREVFGSEHPRALLLFLASREEPIRYSQARDELGLHPQQFQRALDRLEGFGLVGLKAPADLNDPEATRTYYVFLEPTSLGAFCAALWERINEDFSSLAREHDIPEEALAAAVGAD